MKRAVIGLVGLGVVGLAAGDVAAEVFTASHAKVEYQGIDGAQAEALGKTLAAAWKVYTEEFGFKMPETVLLEVKCGPEEPTRLWTDGQDRLYLALPSKDKLAKPADSGVFNLYGICHELGHMAMCRVLKDRDWMSSAAAEGWAHYAGSVVVDQVFAAQGEALWPDRYDYRQDGTTRLKKQLAGKQPSKIDQGAGQWQKLEGIVGRAGLVKLFGEWQAANIDATKPAEALLATGTRIWPDKKDTLTAWWKTAAPLFIEKVSASDIKAAHVPATMLTGKPTVLAFDDDASEGKKSIAGGGHARRFSAPGVGEWYIRAVSVYGSRYGYPKAPAATFDVALCDEQLKTICVWKKPYGTFERGDMKWVRMEVPPTRVPAKFNVCLDFRPTAKQGVYVAFDASTKGNSMDSTPGKPGSAFEEGDWMIRVELDQPKGANPLSAN